MRWGEGAPSLPPAARLPACLERQGKFWTLVGSRPGSGPQPLWGASWVSAMG